MPVVPLFHANGWSFALAAPVAGCALVLPGPRLDGPSVYDLIREETALREQFRDYTLPSAA